MTAILNTLKLTAARKTRALPEIMKRINKLLMKLGEQRMLATAQAQGQHYTPTRFRSFADADTGARIVKQVPVRIKPRFFDWSARRVLVGDQRCSQADAKSVRIISSAPSSLLTPV
jgi:hypothetical protein